MSKPDRFEKDRLVKLDKIVELGHDPYGQRFDDYSPINEVRDLCPEESGTEGPAVRVTGRIMLRRKAGKLWFFNIKDATCRHPVALLSRRSPR